MRALLSLAGLLPALALATPASAEAPWPEVRIGGNACFADHVHYGSSKGEPSKKAALAAAGASFSAGVDFEYGATYASWAIAAHKKIDCYQDGGSWSCVVYALPCRKGK